LTTWLNTPIQMQFRVIDGLSVRIEIAGNTPGAHYISGHLKVGGIMIPTKHRIFPRSPDGQALSEPLMVSIDVSEIAFT
jgi:hypothetical protein